MSVSQIKRGVYTRVDSSNIESNQGTYFEAIMAPTFSIQMDCDATGASTPVTNVHSFFSITGLVAHKINAGGAGDTLTLNRLRGAATDPICTFDVATATVGGENLLPEALDTVVMDFIPGDGLTLVGAAAAGVPTAEVHITVRID
jgi:hypothetical protein